MFQPSRIFRMCTCIAALIVLVENAVVKHPQTVFHESDFGKRSQFIYCKVQTRFYKTMFKKLWTWEVVIWKKITWLKIFPFVVLEVTVRTAHPLKFLEDYVQIMIAAYYYVVEVKNIFKVCKDSNDVWNSFLNQIGNLCTTLFSN